jgi:two-component system, LuxR family, response regulator FixJ
MVSDLLDMKSTRPRRGGSASAGATPKNRIYAVAADSLARADFLRLVEGLADAGWQDYETAEDFLRDAPGLAPGAVLIFDAGTRSDTVKTVTWLAQYKPDLPSIVVSANASVAMAVDCLKAGAIDFLAEPVVGAAATAALGVAFAPPRERPTRSMMLRRQWISSRLSQRELQVLKELMGGLSNKAIGVKLEISERTVEVHRSRIMRRMDVDSFAQLVRLAVEAGLESA